MLLVVCIRLYVANFVHLVHALQYASAVHIAHAVFFCTCCGLLLYIVLCFAVCNVEHLVHVAWIVHWINISTCGQYLYICYMFVLSLHSGMCGQCWNMHLSLVHVACCVHSVICCKCCPSRTCPSRYKCGQHCTCGLFLYMLRSIVVHRVVLCRLLCSAFGTCGMNCALNQYKYMRSVFVHMLYVCTFASFGYVRSMLEQAFKFGKCCLLCAFGCVLQVLSISYMPFNMQVRSTLHMRSFFVHVAVYCCTTFGVGRL